MSTPKPIQMVAHYDNAVLALTKAGELFELGNGKQDWQPIPGPEDGGRIVSITIRPNGTAIAPTATGMLFEQYRAGVQMGDYTAAWRLLPSLPEG